MRISIITNPVVGGWSPWDVRLGGSEESYVAWAIELRRLGHDVVVYHNGIRYGEYRGVSFRDRSDYLSGAGGGVTLNCNYPDLSPIEPTVYFNNLVDAKKYDLSHFQAVIHPSEWARDNLGITHSNQVVVPHGYYPEEIYRDEKIPKTVLYASSPDRGLREIEKVWPEVLTAHPDAQLLVTYNGRLDLPNTLCFGDLATDDMAELYRSSDIWCHPALGGELFGITGIKAQVAGCWPVYYPTMALSETVKFGTACNPSSLLASLVSALSGHPDAPELKFVDWAESTAQLEAVLLKYS